MTSAAIYFRGEDASLADAGDALRSQDLTPDAVLRRVGQGKWPSASQRSPS